MIISSYTVNSIYCFNLDFWSDIISQDVNNTHSTAHSCGTRCPHMMQDYCLQLGFVPPGVGWVVPSPLTHIYMSPRTFEGSILWVSVNPYYTGGFCRSWTHRVTCCKRREGDREKREEVKKMHLLLWLYRHFAISFHVRVQHKILNVFFRFALQIHDAILSLWILKHLTGCFKLYAQYFVNMIRFLNAIMHIQWWIICIYTIYMYVCIYVCIHILYIHMHLCI